MPLPRILPTLRVKFDAQLVKTMVEVAERTQREGGLVIGGYISDFVDLAKKVANAMADAEIPSTPEAGSVVGALGVWSLTLAGLSKEDALELIGAAYDVLYVKKQ